MTITEMNSIVKPLDAVCTGSNSLFARTIRFVTAKRVGMNGLTESIRLRLSSHVGLIVWYYGVFYIAEMMGTGLECNPLSDYFVGNKKILAVRRLQFSGYAIADGNNFVKSLLLNGQIRYSKSELANFLGFRKNTPSDMYCSEFCENIAMKYGKTWSSWQLRNRTECSGIAPCEIQYGCGEKVWDMYGND